MQQTEWSDASRQMSSDKPKGEAQAIKLAPLRGDIIELVDLYIQQQKSAALCSDAIKAAAERTGLMTGVVRQLVKARAGEKYDAEKAKVEQLALVFEEVGDE